jgi:hypothetical protein
MLSGVAMSLRDLIEKWLPGPSRTALLLGLGAISASGVQAAGPVIDSGNKPKAVPQQSGKAFGELAIWLEGGRIFVAEHGKPAQELPLGNTAEAVYLRELLERSGANAASPTVLPDRMIFVGSGGSGIGWVPAGPKQMPGKPAAPAPGFAPTSPSAPAQTTPREPPHQPARTNPPKTREGT